MNPLLFTNPIVPVEEMARLVPRLKVEEAVPPMTMEDVVMYPELFVHCEMFGEAKFPVPRPVEVVSTAVPFWLMVPEALNAPFWSSCRLRIERVEVGERVELAAVMKKGMLFATTLPAETETLPTLFPHPRHEVTVSVPIVEEGVRDSLEEAMPMILKFPVKVEVALTESIPVLVA